MGACRGARSDQWRAGARGRDGRDALMALTAPWDGSSRSRGGRRGQPRSSTVGSHPGHRRSRPARDPSSPPRPGERFRCTGRPSPWDCTPLQPPRAPFAWVPSRALALQAHCRETMHRAPDAAAIRDRDRQWRAVAIRKHPPVGDGRVRAAHRSRGQGLSPPARRSGARSRGTPRSSAASPSGHRRRTSPRCSRGRRSPVPGSCAGSCRRSAR